MLVFGRNFPPRRYELAKALEPVLREKAKEAQRAAGERHGRGQKLCQKPDKAIEAPVDVKKDIQEAAGISHDTIAKAKFVDAHADAVTWPGTRGPASECGAVGYWEVCRVQGRGSWAGAAVRYTSPSGCAAASGLFRPIRPPDSLLPSVWREHDDLRRLLRGRA